MKYFCTVSDKNFISRVSALNYSLKQFYENYRLLVLCLDDDMVLPDSNMVKYDLSTLLKQDQKLYDAQTITPSFEAIRNKPNFEEATKLQFTWSLASYFSNYCLNADFVTEDILYIDADIFFFSDWRKLYAISSYADIGLVEHRIPFTGDSGKYNVGIVYFKKNQNGLACSKFWKDCLLDPKNPFYNDYGNCGDQKYLELFPKMFDNVCSFDDIIGHLAPWNLPYHRYTNNQILWNNKLQDITYYHFSNFIYDQYSFIPGPRHGVNDVSSVPLLQKLHIQYHNILKQYA